MLPRVTEAMTPREILAQLDLYVVGQDNAKRAVAVALRNRWRRRQLPDDLAKDVYPKNILLIGPTGVGKTEISRRLAGLARAPFVKVEASKYSEVGYHGRDVESMVRDLVDAAVALVRQEKAVAVEAQAKRHGLERVYESMLTERGLEDWRDPVGADMESMEGSTTASADDLWRPEPLAKTDPEAAAAISASTEERAQERAKLRAALESGSLDDELLELELLDQSNPTMSIMGPQGNETMGIDASALQEMWGKSPAPRKKRRKLTVAEALSAVADEEADKLIDQDAIAREAVQRAESDGIIFLDEIDKVIGGSHDGPDVSREGVQRDLLPVVEGCAVYTRYGHIRTDHVLFVAAGAFHFHKPSELIPELQGRFPVRVALTPLTEADFVRILKEPKNSLIRQYEALFATEEVTLSFTDDAVQRLAAVAFRANKTLQDIGARRLMTILEKCLEELSFQAAEMAGQTIVVDAEEVTRRLGETADDEDLIRYDI